MSRYVHVFLARPKTFRNRDASTERVVLICERGAQSLRRVYNSLRLQYHGVTCISVEKGEAIRGMF